VEVLILPHQVEIANMARAPVAVETKTEVGAVVVVEGVVVVEPEGEDVRESGMSPAKKSLWLVSRTTQKNY
jgi:hypothetical protein